MRGIFHATPVLRGPFRWSTLLRADHMDRITRPIPASAYARMKKQKKERNTEEDPTSANPRTEIFHDPSCADCRDTLSVLKMAKAPRLRIREFLRDPPTKQELEELLRDLRLLEPRDLMRKEEPLYKEQNLEDPSLTQDQLLEALSRHPKLLQRPIVRFFEPTTTTTTEQPKEEKKSKPASAATTKERASSSSSSSEPPKWIAKALIPNYPGEALSVFMHDPYVMRPDSPVWKEKKGGGGEDPATLLANLRSGVMNLTPEQERSFEVFKQMFGGLEEALMTADSEEEIDELAIREWSKLTPKQKGMLGLTEEEEKEDGNDEAEAAEGEEDTMSMEMNKWRQTLGIKEDADEAKMLMEMNRWRKKLGIALEAEEDDDEEGEEIEWEELVSHMRQLMKEEEQEANEEHKEEERGEEDEEDLQKEDERIQEEIQRLMSIIEPKKRK
ncbi:Acidic leucine-rich nuclear phosphoprotein 32-related protein [Balamuthia mandrillaris]